MNNDGKIKISKGCAEYLIEEVDRLRKENELLGVENRVMNNFFTLVERIGPDRSQSYTEDLLFQAKREIAEAIKKSKEVQL